jgi:hypothetical protein
MNKFKVCPKCKRMLTVMCMNNQTIEMCLNPKCTDYNKETIKENNNGYNIQI